MLEAQSYVRKYLADKIKGAHFYVNMPKGTVAANAPFAIVRRIGGNRPDVYRDRPSIGIDVYDTTEAKTCKLAFQIDAAMQNIIYENGVADLSSVSIRSTPDMETHTPKWFLDYVLTVY